MIIVRIWDGLGNQLFQYAYARSLVSKGFTVKLDLGKAYDSSFEKYKNHDKRENSLQKYNISIPVAEPDEIKSFSFLKRESLSDRLKYHLAKHRAWKYSFYEEKEQHYDQRSLDIRDDSYIKGWFQSERYFSDIREVIEKE
ncbi:MAG: hypothetical protein K6E34_01165, partial [Lachnospiraceae bacterium]|nr:hypothetical protein [Lachnospiraceae bacterium]